MPWCGPEDAAEIEDTASKTTEVLSGLTKVKIAFFEVDPVTKAGKIVINFSVNPSPLVTSWAFELIGTWLGRA